MNITVSNIIEQYPKIDVQLPKELNQHEYEFIKENIDLYSEDDTIKKYIDTFVAKLNQFASKESKPKKVPAPRFKYKKGQDVYIKASGKKVKLKLSSTKGNVSPSGSTMPEIIYMASDNKEYSENELTSRKLAEKKKTTLKKENKKQEKRVVTQRKETSRKAKPKAEKPIVPVEHFTLEERIIKRYLLLDGKTKTKDQLLNFIKFLQRAITEKKIRKTSKYADLILDIQNSLVSTYNALPEKAESINFNIVPKKAEQLRKIVGDKKVRLSATYIKRFIGMYGKETEDKAQKLIDLIDKAIDSGNIPTNDPYLKQLKTVQKALENYIAKQDIKISDAELKGLAGIAGTTIPQNSIGNPFENSDVVSSLDLQKAVFRHMGFTGIWKKIIGDPEEPFHVMIYGPGGKGKSTFSIKFATYLSKQLNRSVLYIADEEKISSKLKEKLQLFDAYNKNLAVTGKMPKSLKKYEVVFLDSVTSMGMEPEELEEIQEQYPNTCFIYILQTNKQGSFYGKKKWEHLCDVVLRFEDGTVKVDKNRFGKVGEYEV